MGRGLEYPRDVYTEGSNRKKRRQLRALHERQQGFCYWCGKLCHLPHDPYYFKGNGKIRDGAATIDHLFSRFNPVRKLKLLIPRQVMSCAACNRKRSKQECLELDRPVRDGYGVEILLERPLSSS